MNFLQPLILWLGNLIIMSLELERGILRHRPRSTPINSKQLQRNQTRNDNRNHKKPWLLQ